MIAVHVGQEQIVDLVGIDISSRFPAGFGTNAEERVRAVNQKLFLTRAKKKRGAEMVG